MPLDRFPFVPVHRKKVNNVHRNSYLFFFVKKKWSWTGVLFVQFAHERLYYLLFLFSFFVFFSFAKPATTKAQREMIHEMTMMTDNWLHAFGMHAPTAPTTDEIHPKADAKKKNKSENETNEDNREQERKRERERDGEKMARWKYVHDKKFTSFCSFFWPTKRSNKGGGVGGGGEMHNRWVVEEAAATDCCDVIDGQSPSAELYTPTSAAICIPNGEYAFNDSRTSLKAIAKGLSTWIAIDRLAFDRVLTIRSFFLWFSLKATSSE